MKKIINAALLTLVKTAIVISVAVIAICYFDYLNKWGDGRYTAILAVTIITISGFLYLFEKAIQIRSLRIFTKYLVVCSVTAALTSAVWKEALWNVDARITKVPTFRDPMIVKTADGVTVNRGRSAIVTSYNIFGEKIKEIHAQGPTFHFSHEQKYLHIFLEGGTIPPILTNWTTAMACSVAIV